jgi:hypothetical protein
MGFVITVRTLCRSLNLWLLLCATVKASAVSVTFQVDVSVQIANGTFTPVNGDTVEARGDFNGWSGGFTLTNSPISTNIFTGIYNDTNTPGSQQGYKLLMVIGGGANWEVDFTPATGNNRTFSLANTPQILPVVYFNDMAPSSGVPTQSVTFQVDMSDQIAKGNFNPTNGDTVEARGMFQTPNQWAGGFTLTNNPNAANTNLYAGTYADGNYPGTQEAYKFVIVSGGDHWEFIDNRPLTLQNGGQTLPAVFFNNQPGTLIPVNFQVDMSVQVANGKFNPGVDSVEAQGTFQSLGTWSGGFQLTNNPSASNTNLYTGTYMDASASGTAEQYKYVVDGGSGPLGWEQPASTGTDNRSFIVAASAQTLPAVYFSDLGPGDTLAADTWVTFSVSMTNAVGTDGVHFNPSVDSVSINGDFLGWWGWGSFPPNQLTNNPPGSEIYSLTLLLSKGNPVTLKYKYGIDGADDEAGFKLNHVRYIRTVGNSVMPLDTFGSQYVEPSFGSLNARSLSAGSALISWLGRPGVHLQTTTSLVNAVWQDRLETDGLSSTNWPVGNGNLFFRLIKP